MNTLIKYVLKNRIKLRYQDELQQGFTLIELLVAMIIAVLVITPLLGFMVNILDTDRKEQAKTNSEQEIQTALDYIAQDMEQAIYIYDADSLYGKVDSDTTKSIPGIINQLPNSTEITKVPILVFWKRYFLGKDQVVRVNASTERQAGCLTNLLGGTCNNQDYMLYSLVVYYLVNDNSTTWNQTTARIERWEIRDGIRRDEATGGETRTETVNGTTTPRTVRYNLLPDKGFMPFNLSVAGDLNKKFGSWTRHSENYDLNVNRLTTLVDFIDQSRVDDGAPTPSCNADEQQVPRYGTSGAPANLQTGSFYACVNSEKYIARVFIRGNALARFQTGGKYSQSNSQYFPTASIQIKGRGFLGVE